MSENLNHRWARVGRRPPLARSHHALVRRGTNELGRRLELRERPPQHSRPWEADALLAMRKEGRRSGRGCEAQAKRCAEESALTAVLKSVRLVSPTAQKDVAGGVLDHRAILAWTGRRRTACAWKHLTYWVTW